MRVCPTCKNTYPDDANFCPQETCATAAGPQRLQAVAAAAETRARFQVGARIGGGNTGEVWRATDGQGGGPVAYKLVSAEVLPNPAALARAEREFKQLLRVSSPRIATIIDCGKTADDRLYVAMELCPGESLEQLLRNGALPFEKAKSIVVQIGQALLEAQKAGIVHRDVAPKNVLVAPSGDAKVINFPLAKPINDRAAGVAAYLSPEQIQGKPVDQRSNTYSLAALFYHLLTGEPPFQGPPETVLELHLSSPPLAPSQRRPEAALTPEVDRVILKALDKSSSRRHLTLRLFLSEVEALTAPPGVQPAAAKDAGVGFARTMLFAGGQAEVANLVAKAIAARTGSPPRGVPVAPAAAAAAAPAPAPAPARPTVAQVAQAVAAAAPRRVPTPAATPAVSPPAVAAPVAPPAAAPPRLTTNAAVAAGATTNGNAAADEFNDRMARLTPPPVTPYPPPRAPALSVNTASVNTAAATIAASPGPSHAPSTAPPSAPAPAPAPVAAAAPPNGADHKETPAKEGAGKAAEAGKGAAFRETLWFKKGDVEHMIAEARAKMASGNKEAAVEAEPEVGLDESKPIEDRYVDDGSVTSDDRKKYSLRTGGTATAIPVVRAGAVPGEAMSEREVIREVSGTRRAVILVAVGLVVAGIVGGVLWMMRDRPSLPPAPAPAARAIPEPPPPGAPPAQPAGLAAGRTVTKPRPTDSAVAGQGQGRLEARAGAAGASKRSDSADKRSSRRRSNDRRSRR
jgi:eukaryotic-like serine/threonine-protein kinase